MARDTRKYILTPFVLTPRLFSDSVCLPGSEALPRATPPNLAGSAGSNRVQHHVARDLYPHFGAVGLCSGTFGTPPQNSGYARTECMFSSAWRRGCASHHPFQPDLGASIVSLLY